MSCPSFVHRLYLPHGDGPWHCPGLGLAVPLSLTVCHSVLSLDEHPLDSSSSDTSAGQRFPPHSRTLERSGIFFY